MRKNTKIILTIISAVIILFILFILSVYAGLFGKIPGHKELLSYQGATASLVLSAEGEIIGRFFQENRTNIHFRQIPSHLKDALLATEDIRFYKHRGIDIRSMFRVLVRSVIMNDRAAGGGSTISQQLAKNIYGRNKYGFLSMPVNKCREMIIARRMEKAFTKEQILTLYLNTVSFGENVFGIEAAARRYYSKRVDQLSIEESAVLVGMLKASTFYNPRLYPENARTRRNIVLRQMARYGYLENAFADSLMAVPLSLNYFNLESSGPAGYFLVQVRKEAENILRMLREESGREWDVEKDGLIISSTLNLILQNHALKAFRSHLPVMQERLVNQYRGSVGQSLLSGIVRQELTRLNLNQRSDDTVFMRVFDWEGSYNKKLTVEDSIRQALLLLHAGMLALDPSTGAVVTWVGGIDFLTQPFDQVLARRQMASAFKPVLYAAALEQGISPCRYFDNDSVIVHGYEDWSPVNYSALYGGQYSLAGALSKSMNIPTFHLFLEVGFHPVDALWKAMGFSFQVSNTPSLALGTAEANILETAIAYAAFANGGYKVDPYLIESIITSEGDTLFRREINAHPNRVLSENTALLMNAMLEKAINEGTGTSLRNVYGVNLPLAGKTGTSQNYADAWFAAYNPSLVIVSRAGASTRAVRFNNGSFGSGSALALPLVALTLRDVQRDRDIIDLYSEDFTELPLWLEGTLDCPDYREKNFIDRLRELLRSEGITFDEDKERPRRGRSSFLRRLFER